MTTVAPWLTVSNATDALGHVWEIGRRRDG
jgi:hypothetical protein